MTTPTIELPPLASPVDELWHMPLDLGERLTLGGLGPEGLPADTQLLVTAPPNRTIEVPGGTQAPARHLRDLALLCTLVEDPFEMREQLTRKDLRRLRQMAALHDPAHPAWALVDEDIRSSGRAALAILTG